MIGLRFQTIYKPANLLIYYIYRWVILLFLNDDLKIKHICEQAHVYSGILCQTGNH